MFESCPVVFGDDSISLTVLLSHFDCMMAFRLDETLDSDTTLALTIRQGTRRNHDLFPS